MVMGSTNMGGTQMFILNLLNNLDLTHYQIDIAVNFEELEGGIGPELKQLGCKIYKLPYFKVYNYTEFVREWMHFLQTHKYDIVHGHSTNSAAIYLKIAKDLGAITIAHCHSVGFRGNKIQRIFKRFFSRQIRDVADYWFACSSDAAEHLYGKGFINYPKFYIIPNAINPDKYLYNNEIALKIRSELKIGSNDFVCGHIGSFTLPKNHKYLLSVFKEVLFYKPDAKLICCGAGKLMTEIKNIAKDLNILDHIIFTGIVKNINEYLMAMDILIFPSFFEGFPISVLESEAAGLQVVMSDTIASDVGITDCIHRLPLSCSPKIWAETIVNLKSNNRRSYNNIVANSRYNMRTSAKFIDSLYKNIVKNVVK